MQRTIALMGDKWKILVFLALSDGSKRFGQVQRTLEGVTAKVLTRQLRDLERDGFLTRAVHAEIPPRVEYELTDLGRSFLPIVHQLKDWSEAHADELGGRRELVSA
ncbi:MAG TPA: helix-turn-helix domain-containing protein [Candidatus Eremiobacteraceae bacterium]|nr:helix-turn-helix domain-containing protein [Candidatus Eremiobacteraceae bacterium]